MIMSRARFGRSPEKVIVIASQSEVGAFYGAFHFLRLLQTRADISALERAGISALDDGQKVTFDTETGRDGREAATNLALA